MALLLCASCAHTDQHHIPVVRLPSAPGPVRQTIEQSAAGRRIEKINYLPFQTGTLYRAYIADPAGPQLLTVDAQGRILENAVAVPFETLPPAVQDASRTAVAGQLQVCRKSQVSPGIYLLDYLLSDEEPVYAVIETNGFVRAVVGYSVEDPD